MNNMRIVLIGYGKMGKEIERLAVGRGHQVVARIDVDNQLDLEQLEELPTNKIDGFDLRLEKLIPSMIKHRCSKDYAGGFFERVKEGIWIIGMQVIRINDEHVPYWIDLAKVEEWVNLGGNRLAS